MIGLYVKDTFLSAYEALDGVYKNRTLKTLAQFMCGILMPAKNLEKLPKYPSLYTIRTNDKYRTLVKKVNADSYILLFAGCHDAVYEWCEKNKKSHKKIGKNLSDYKEIVEALSEITEYIEKHKNDMDEKIEICLDAEDAVEKENIREDGYFKKFTDKQLLKGLADENELLEVRNWVTQNECEEGLKNLSKRSNVFISALMQTGRLDDAMHSVFVSEKHEEKDKKLSETIDSIRNYAKAKTNCTYNISEEKEFITCFFYSGLFGANKTTKLINIIQVNEDYLCENTDKRKALFLICNPDSENETKSYIDIVFGKKLDFLEILTFDELIKKHINECSKRWKLDFTIEELSQKKALYEIFRECVIETDGDDSNLEWFIDEWNTIVEEKGVFTDTAYLNCSRIGSFPIDEDEEYQFACFLNTFVSKMKSTGIYTPGFALHRFYTLCKKKNYRPYSIIYVDDIHLLSQAQMDLISLFCRDDKSRFTYDTMFTVGSPYFLETDRRIRKEFNVVGLFSSRRMVGKKAEWVRKFNDGLLSPVLYEKAHLDIKRSEKSTEEQDNNLIAIPFQGKYSDKEKMISSLIDFVKKLKTPELDAIVAADQDEALYIASVLDEMNVKHMLTGNNYSTVDNLLDSGIRICTLSNIGSSVFDNVIVFRPEEKIITDISEVPSYVRSQKHEDIIAARVYLFERAVCASLKNTYYLSSSEDKNLFVA